MDFVVRCSHTRLVPISELIAHPKNRNKHPKDQIERLAKILKYQGIRYPVKVSNQSGFVTSGHGRIEAAKLNGWIQMPVDFQDYANSDQEYADVQADNAIASWSELDLAGINSDLAEIGPIDIETLGLKNFLIEPMDKFIESELYKDEFEKPSEQCKVVIITNNESASLDLLNCLHIKNHKKFQDGKLLSARWPDLENE